MDPKKRSKKSPERDQALHDATHGQFGEEPRPGPMPKEKDVTDSSDYVKDRMRAAYKKSRTA
jgi:hypothetical protein